ncbi:MAG: VanZ family protein [Lachnospiraceae bacterium]
MRILRALLKPLSFLPALCLMYMIFSFSAQDGATSSQLSYKVSYTIVETGGKILGENWEPWQIDSIATRFHGAVRKLAHMTEYFALAVSVAFPLYVYGLRGIWLMLVAGFICVAFSCGDEYHQSFVAGRSPSKRDVMIDSIGIFFGVILTRIIGWTGRKTIFRPFSDDHINRKKHKQKQADFEQPNGYVPNGYAPNGYPQNGYSPNPYPRQPYYQNGQQPDAIWQCPVSKLSKCTIPKYTIPKRFLSKRAIPKRSLSKCTGAVSIAGSDDDYVSDRLSEDMSFRKLMQDIKEQKTEAHREHQLQREYPATKQPAKKRHVRLPPRKSKWMK